MELDHNQLASYVGAVVKTMATGEEQAREEANLYKAALDTVIAESAQESAEWLLKCANLQQRVNELEQTLSAIWGIGELNG